MTRKRGLCGFSRLIPFVLPFDRKVTIIGGTMLKRRFSFLSLSWLLLLMSVMFIGALDFGNAQAQTAAFTRAKDTVSVQLANTGGASKQDFLVANQTIDSLKAYVSSLNATGSYMVRFVFRAGVLKFTGDSVVVRTSNSSDSVWAYTNGKPVALPSTKRIVAQGFWFLVDCHSLFSPIRISFSNRNQ